MVELDDPSGLTNLNDTMIAGVEHSGPSGTHQVVSWVEKYDPHHPQTSTLLFSFLAAL